MRIFAHYDVSGTIHSVVVVDGPEGALMMLTPRRGHLVAEVEGLPVKPGAIDLAELRKIAASHRVDVATPRRRVIKKS